MRDAPEINVTIALPDVRAAAAKSHARFTKTPVAATALRLDGWAN
jgi:hypothetical protein